MFAPPRDVLAETPYTYVSVTAGEVGSSVRLNTVVRWRQDPIAMNQAAGTVTSVAIKSGSEVHPGEVVYSVSLRPVVIAVGEVPAFRSLARQDHGDDVEQVQQMLADLGFYDGDIDGQFGWVTESAVKTWQRSLGVEGDGVVQLGDVIFVPSLPLQVALDNELVFRGAVLSGGEPALLALSTEPAFTIPATRTQAASMPAGTPVQLNAPDGSAWTAEVAAQTDSAESADQVDVELQGIGGARICGDDCSTIPLDEEVRLPSTIETTPAVEGLVVPSAALLSSADRTVSVVDDDGQKHRVQVIASARGMSVIEGASEGMRVRIPATDEDSTASRKAGS
ncbi:peptidoglycan-binding protein [Agromyces sp. GXQ0307]|uniref:peptidoglycan-binding domain-containing protein n=1 Tax=Agromyces sp. GXQ0307 TaxID=3377835 RepID=UPI00383B9C0A